MLARITALLALAFLVAPGSIRAQDVAQQIREAMKSDVFNVELLFRTDAHLRLDGGTRSRFDVAVARLRVGGRLDGGFRYFGQFEFAEDPELLDLRLGWSPGPEFLVRAGRFKTPFSGEFLTFFGARDFNAPARMVRRLAPNRQYGVEVSGRSGEHFRWQVGGFTDTNDSGGNERGLGVARVVVDRLFASENGSGLSIGANAGFGSDQAIARRVYDNFRGEGTLVGFDARFERGPIMLSGEWLRGDFESHRIAPDQLPGPRPPIESGASGFQITGAYHFTDQLRGLVRWDRFEAPELEAEDMMLFSLDYAPTDQVRLQTIYRAPLGDSRETHRLISYLQLYF